MGSSAQQKRRQAARGGTRAQRRAQERVQAKRAPQKSSSLPAAQLIGGLITIVAVLIIAGYAIYQSNSHKTTTNSTGPALTHVSAFKITKSPPKVGTTAPDFTLKGIDGKSYSLAAQKGHPVFLEFFADWCPHCHNMGPVIQKLSNQYSSKGVRFWMVLANPYGPNYDASLGQDTTPASKADLQEFTTLYGETLPKLIDPNFTVVNDYGVSSYPGLYVVDKTGKISYSDSGEKPSATLAAAIQKALK